MTYTFEFGGRCYQIASLWSFRTRRDRRKANRYARQGRIYHEDFYPCDPKRCRRTPIIHNGRKPT